MLHRTDKTGFDFQVDLQGPAKSRDNPMPSRVRFPVPEPEIPEPAVIGEVLPKQPERPPSSLERVTTNLYRRRTGGHAWWILLYRSPVTGRRTEMSLGAIELLTVTTAKKLTIQHRATINAGRCPLTERRAEQAARKARIAPSAPTFRETFRLCLAARAKGWKRKNLVQWERSIAAYALPILGDLLVNEIGVAEVMQVLQPIWYDKPETASRVRARIEGALDFAKVRGWRDGPNPAVWRAHLDQLLPARSQVRPERHFSAIGWAEAPGLYQTLAGHQDVSALALRYVLLTALRTGEVLGATPAEIDRTSCTHVIPAERMKAGREHRVPLTAEALRVLDQAEALRTGAAIFCGARGGQLSDMALLMKLRGLYPGRKVTTHGMRSAFRDWCSEMSVARELAERQLAHGVKDATERAYLRTDALDPRRALAERWTQFLTAPAKAGGVTDIEVERRARTAL